MNLTPVIVADCVLDGGVDTKICVADSDRILKFLDENIKVIEAPLANI